MTKADKLGRQQARQAMRQVAQDPLLANRQASLLVLLFSTLSRTGVEDLQQAVESLITGLPSTGRRQAAGGALICAIRMRRRRRRTAPPHAAIRPQRRRHPADRVRREPSARPRRDRSRTLSTRTRWNPP